MVTYPQILLVKAVFIALLIPTSASSVSATEKNDSITPSIDQSIFNQYQQIIIRSFEFYIKKIKQNEQKALITIQNFPVLIEDNIESVTQQDFHTELFFSKLYKINIKPQIVQTITSNKLIQISSRPVNGGFLSSKFGIRKDPFHGSRRMHNGIDIAAKYGSPVKPLGKGIIVFSGYKSGFGKMVEIKHGKTVKTRYAHLKEFLVTKGQKVNTDDKIGLVGTSGRSTGPHLHLEVLLNEKQVDPQIFLVNHFGSRRDSYQVARIKSKSKAKAVKVVKTRSVVNEIVKTIVKSKESRAIPKVSDFPQVSYQDYVESVDGLFGFSAPKPFSQ